MSMFECSSGSEGVLNAETEPFPVLFSRAISAIFNDFLVRPPLLLRAACLRDETQQHVDNATACEQRVRLQSLRTR